MLKIPQRSISQNLQAFLEPASPMIKEELTQPKVERLGGTTKNLMPNKGRLVTHLMKKKGPSLLERRQ